MNGEPKDTQLAFIWNLDRYTDAVSQATNYLPEHCGPRSSTKRVAALATARKHARRMMTLAGLTPHDPASREALKDLIG